MFFFFKKHIKVVCKNKYITYKVQRESGVFVLVSTNKLIRNSAHCIAIGFRNAVLALGHVASVFYVSCKKSVVK